MKKLLNEWRKYLTEAQIAQWALDIAMGANTKMVKRNPWTAESVHEKYPNLKGVGVGKSKITGLARRMAARNSKLDLARKIEKQGRR